ncbi:hypothetical protein AgCh_035781 [Apium graveolens]
MAVKRYCNLSFLPSEIIESEILPRLPVKSVLRFKSVCKSWNLLISNNPDFIKSHLDLNPNKDSLLVMTSERKKYEETRDESLFQGSTAMIGSVNGLVCFYNWHHEFEGIEFVIWNPATKQCLANIPLLPSRFEEREHDGLIEDCFGFGFDSVANDFKVMYVITIEDQPLVGDIYSCKQRCWKKITPSNFLFRGYVPPLALQVVFRGSPYWLNVQPNGKNSRLTVIWFDVQNEIFRLLPEIGSIDQKQDAVIMNFEDSIAVMVYNRKVLLTEPVDVYVFNERCDVWRKMSIGPVIGKELTIYRIPLIFQGDLVHVAASHLKEEDYVYIDGQPSADSPPSALKCEKSSFQVMVHNVNFVEGSSWKKNYSDRKILVPLGQKINATKSSMFYSRNTETQTKQEVYSILNFNEADEDTQDLGLPNNKKRKKTAVLSYLKDRLSTRV